MSAILLLAFIPLVIAGYDDLRYFKLIAESENVLNNRSLSAVSSSTSSQGWRALFSFQERNEQPLVFDPTNGQLMGSDIINLQPWFINIASNGTFTGSFNPISSFAVANGYLTYNGTANNFSACNDNNFYRSLFFNSPENGNFYKVKFAVIDLGPVFLDHEEAVNYNLYAANVRIESSDSYYNNSVLTIDGSKVYGTVNVRQSFGTYTMAYNSKTNDIRSLVRYNDTLPIRYTLNENARIIGSICAKEEVQVNKDGYLEYKGNSEFVVTRQSVNVFSVTQVEDKKHEYTRLKLKLLVAGRINPQNNKLPSVSDFTTISDSTCKSIRQDDFLDKNSGRNLNDSSNSTKDLATMNSSCSWFTLLGWLMIFM